MRKILYYFTTLWFAAGCTADLETILEVETRTNVIYAGIVIATDGDDINGDGSYNNPFLTLDRALRECTSGGTIYFREGTYRLETIIEGVSEPTLIAAYPNEKVVVSGAEKITSSWSQYSGNIYVTEPNIKPWQLFEQGKMLNAARTPNVEGYIEDKQPISPYPTTGSIWDQSSTWILSSASSGEGVMIADDPTALSSINYSLEGAMAILNVGSFKTAYTPVTSHSVGSNSFSYDMEDIESMGLTWQKPSLSYFYLEGKLEMLDSAGEWFYDTTSNRLYLYSKAGIDPTDLTIEGKTQSYAIKLSASSNVTISGIEFYATTVSAESSPSTTIAGCTFSYPSHSQRALGVGCDDYIDVTIFDSSCPSTSILNSTFQYTEGEAIVLYGPNSLVANNLFRHIDYTCANLRNIGASINILSANTTFSNNTVYVCGASETILPGSGATIYANEIYSTAHLQNDGAIIQFMATQSVNSRAFNNWFHNSRRNGLRIDGEKNYDQNLAAGDNQTLTSVYNNVFWDCGGMMIKGDHHMVVNNTIFSTDENPTTICTIYVIDREGDDGEGGEYGSNHSTICFNNITDLISSYYSDERWDTFPLPDGVFSNYVAYYTSNYIITDLLMDVDNRDFRPTFFQDLIEAGVVDPEMDEGVAELYERYKSDFLDSEDTSPDMGAVGYNTDEYIIAGRQEAISSAPIPADGAFSSSAGLMLSWKPAYESTASTLYMGTSYDQVFNASPQDIAHIEGNITSSLYYPSKSSYPINQRATTYYWRVDDLVDNNIIKGDVWNFQLY